MRITGRKAQVAGRRLIGVIGVLAAVGVGVVGASPEATVRADSSQTPVAQPQPAPPTPGVPTAPVAAPTPPPVRPVPTRNVRVSVVITDQAGTTAPVVKTVTMVIADGRRNQVRSMSRLRRQSATTSGSPIMMTGELVPLHLNVDAQATVTTDKRVLVELRFNYGIAVRSGAEPSGSATVAADAGVAEISEELALLLTPGTSVVAAESADATSDRKVKVEVRAEILP